MWYSWVRCIGRLCSPKTRTHHGLYCHQSWWLATAAKGKPFAGHLWYFSSLTSQSTMLWHLDSVKPRLDHGKAPEETGKSLVRTSNPEKTAYPKNPSFCSLCEKDSAGGCWCPFSLTHRTTARRTWSKCEILWVLKTTSANLCVIIESTLLSQDMISPLSL